MSTPASSGGEVAPLHVNAASLSTFSGMHTDEDFNTTEAREDAQRQADEGGEEVDEIVQELPIVLSQTLAQTLYLMQSPLRSDHTDRQQTTRNGETDRDSAWPLCSCA
jgi:hypothetical protein